MEKAIIAEELLKNTRNIYLKRLINEYLKQLDYIEKGAFNKKILHDSFVDSDDLDCLMRFHSCITYIENVQFNITGWQLFEIPIYYSHCFYNEITKEQFDLGVWEIGEVIPIYINDESNEVETDTIQNAISNYSSFYVE